MENNNQQSATRQAICHKELTRILEQADDDHTHFLLVYRKDGVTDKDTGRKPHTFTALRFKAQEKFRQRLLENLTQSWGKVAETKPEDLETYDVIVDNGRKPTLEFYDLSAHQLDIASLFKAPGITEKYLEQGVSIINAGGENAELCAFVAAVQDPQTMQWAYGFGKLTRGNINIPERNPRYLISVFDLADSIVRLLEGPNIQLHNDFDFTVYDGLAFILNRSGFKDTVKLEDEFIQQAQCIIDEVQQHCQIEGLDLLRSEAKASSLVRTRLVKAQQNGNLRIFSDPQSIQKQVQIAQRHGKVLKVSPDGTTVLIKNKKDVQVVVKLLGDYWKIGEASGKHYETFAGKVVG